MSWDKILRDKMSPDPQRWKKVGNLQAVNFYCLIGMYFLLNPNKGWLNDAIMAAQCFKSGCIVIARMKEVWKYYTSTQCILQSTRCSKEDQLRFRFLGRKSSDMTKITMDLSNQGWLFIHKNMFYKLHTHFNMMIENARWANRESYSEKKWILGSWIQVLFGQN